MRVLIIGAGAIGVTTSVILSENGYDITLLCKDEREAAFINHNKLHLKSIKLSKTEEVTAVADFKVLDDYFDFIFLATKANDISHPIRAINKYLKNGLIISFQDGFCEEQIARIVGTERVVGCVVSWGATLNSTGNAEITSKGEFIIGKLDGTDDVRMDHLSFMLEKINPTTTVDNINEHIYSKLIINSCVTTMGAISGLLLADILNTRSMRNVFTCIIREAILVANALEIEVPDFSDTLNFYNLISGNHFLKRLYRHIYIQLFGLKYRRVKSSGLQSLERGQKTEIDFMNGFILEKAAEMGIEVRVNQLLVEMLHEIEDGKRKIGVENLLELGIRCKGGIIH